MRKITLLLALCAVLMASSLQAGQTNFYCYESIDGERFYVRLPIQQPDKPNGAAESLAAGFVALGGLIPRRVAFVDSGSGRVDAPEYLENRGFPAENRLIIQFRPGMGFFCGPLPPGTNQMSDSWLVSRAESHDLIVSGGGNDGRGDAPFETFPVVVILAPGSKRVNSVTDVNDWYHYSSNDYFDEHGKVREAVFDELKGRMRVVYVERHNFVESFHRFRGSDNWSTDEIFYEVPFRESGVVYGHAGDEFADFHAIGFECLTERQGEYVRKGKLGRAWQTVTEGAQNLFDRGIRLLGQ